MKHTIFFILFLSSAAVFAQQGSSEELKESVKKARQELDEQKKALKEQQTREKEELRAREEAIKSNGYVKKTDWDKDLSKLVKQSDRNAVKLIKLTQPEEASTYSIIDSLANKCTRLSLSVQSLGQKIKGEDSDTGGLKEDMSRAYTALNELGALRESAHRQRKNVKILKKAVSDVSLRYSDDVIAACTDELKILRTLLMSK